MSPTFSTLACPHTAPTRRSASGWTSLRSASGAITESESTNATTSAVLSRMPAAIAARLPRFTGKSITRTRPPDSAATFCISWRVASVEPSLTAISSSFSWG